MNPITAYHKTIQDLIAHERKALSRALRETAEAANRDANQVCGGGYSIYDFATMAKEVVRARERLLVLQDELRRFSSLVVETRVVDSKEMVS